MNNFAKNYIKRNKKYKKKLLFRVGYSQGLFSELNHMIAAMLHCDLNNIQFQLYADNANFSNKKGWKEFFQPFCPLIHNKLATKYNYRHYMGYEEKIKKNAFKIKLCKFLLGVDFFTFEKFFSPMFAAAPSEKEFWNLATNYAKLIWRFNKETQAEIDALIESLNLPKNYLALQLRRGDKKDLENTDSPDLSLYANVINNSKVKTVFVLTDDYNDFTALKNLCAKDIQLHTLCATNDFGYYNEIFNNLPWDIKRQKLLKLIASVEIMRNAQFCYGTRIANLSWFLKIIMDDTNFSYIESVEQPNTAQAPVAVEEETNNRIIITDTNRNEDFDIWNNDIVEQVYTNNNNYKIIKTKSKSKKAIIFFSGNGLYFPNKEDIFEDVILKQNHYEWENIAKMKKIRKTYSLIIFVRDILKQWYITGINSNINTQDKLIELLENLTKGYQITTCGNSAGGYIAILTGLKLKAEKIYSFSGQFELGTPFSTGPLIEKFANTPQNKYYSLLNLINNSNIPIFFFYPGLSKQDQEEFEKIKNFQNIYPYKFNETQHGVTVLPKTYKHLFCKDLQTLIKLSKKYKNKLIDKKVFLNSFYPLKTFKAYLSSFFKFGRVSHE